MKLNLQPTENQYYLLATRPELVLRAKKLGFDNAYLLEEFLLEQEDLDYLRKTGKAVFIIRLLYDDLRPEMDQLTFRGQFRRTDTPYLDLDFEGGLDPNSGERKTMDIDEACRMFPDREWFERVRKDWDLFADGTYENRCGNCHAYMLKGEKYCRKCGTEKGKGLFLPFKNNCYAVYGPPIKQQFKCGACGHLWSTEILGGDDSYYCPECGKNAVEILETVVDN